MLNLTAPSELPENPPIHFQSYKKTQIQEASAAQTLLRKIASRKRGFDDGG